MSAPQHCKIPGRVWFTWIRTADDHVIVCLRAVDTSALLSSRFPRSRCPPLHLPTTRSSCCCGCCCGPAILDSCVMPALGSCCSATNMLTHSHFSEIQQRFYMKIGKVSIQYMFTVYFQDPNTAYFIMRIRVLYFFHLKNPQKQVKIKKKLYHKYLMKFFWGSFTCVFRIIFIFPGFCFKTFKNKLK